MKVFTVNLDKEPENRWEEIIWFYKDEILKMVKISEIFLCNNNYQLHWSASKILSLVANMGFISNYEELKGIAKILNISIGEVIMLQLLYEYDTNSISILKKTKDEVFHFRTIDWNISETKPTPININFIKDGNIVFGATTYPGYIGTLTGMKPKNFALSINHRKLDDDYYSNLYYILTSSWQISLLARHVLTNCDNYEEAKFILEEADIISPVYIIISSKDDGCVITRDRINAISPVNLQNQTDIVQTNIDHWINDSTKDISGSIERRAFAYEWINNDNINLDELWDLCKISPILTKNTIYITGMNVNDNYYKSKLIS